MTPNKPYLIRALYEWLGDNDVTPYILVNSQAENVEIPSGIDKDGQVVLNIAHRAVQSLEISNTHISFSARFSGISRNIYIPMQAVLAIYSQESGEGMMFAEDLPEQTSDEGEPGEAMPEKSAKPKKPGLTVVK